MAAAAPTRSYLELLFALLLTWGALLGLSQVNRDIVILGVPLAKVDFARYVHDPNVVDAPPRPLAGVAPLASPLPESRTGAGTEVASRPEPAHVPRPLDRSPQKILVFGDSTVKALMWRLSDYCAENGHSMFAASWYGSTTIGWGVKERLDLLIATHRPSFLIVSLGSSELSLKDVASREMFIRSIMDKIGPRPFVWVGPPNVDADTGINALIERIVGEDHFFRSTGLELARYGDNFHPTEDAGRAWMDAIAHWIVTSSASPIALDLPTKAGPPPDRQIFGQALSYASP
jgi:hypothetical protein